MPFLKEMTVSVVRRGTRYLRTAAPHLLSLQNVYPLLLSQRLLCDLLLPKVKFILQLLLLSIIESCGLFRAQPSDKLTPSGTSTVRAPSAFAVLVSSLKESVVWPLSFFKWVLFFSFNSTFPKEQVFLKTWLSLIHLHTTFIWAGKQNCGIFPVTIALYSFFFVAG